MASKSDIILKHDIGILENWIDREYCAQLNKLFNEKFDANLEAAGLNKESPIQGGFTKNAVNFQKNKKRWDSSFDMDAFGRLQPDAEILRDKICKGSDVYFREIAQNHPDWTEDVSQHVESHVGAEKIMMKVQRTPPGGGFNGPHFEQGPGDSSSRRYAVWMLYINDVEHGGHTAFPRHGLMLQPKAGTLVIWPAAYTHPHHGTPPTNDCWKMIITGWFTHPQEDDPNDESEFRKPRVEEGSD